MGTVPHFALDWLPGTVEIS